MGRIEQLPTGVVVRNLTPHDVTVMTVDGDRVVIPVAGIAARVIDTCRAVSEVLLAGGRIEVADMRAELTNGLPCAEEGVVLVVSRLVAERHPDRADLLVPIDLVRDDAGTVVACRRLARWTR